MLLTSPSFKDGAFIPRKFSCDGSATLTTGGSASFDEAQDKSLTVGEGNINPELHIENVPPDTNASAVILLSNKKASAYATGLRLDFVKSGLIDHCKNNRPLKIAAGVPTKKMMNPPSFIAPSSIIRQATSAILALPMSARKP